MKKLVVKIMLFLSLLGSLSTTSVAFASTTDAASNNEPVEATTLLDIETAANPFSQDNQNGVEHTVAKRSIIATVVVFVDTMAIGAVVDGVLHYYAGYNFTDIANIGVAQIINAAKKAVKSKKSKVYFDDPRTCNPSWPGAPCHFGG